MCVCVCTDINCCSPVMSTNIVGFLLMTKFRNVSFWFSQLINCYCVQTVSYAL